jgi:hypothetical protein
MPFARATEPPLARLLPPLLLALSVGCEPEVEQLRWGISFAEGTNLSQQAVAVSAWIKRENCDGKDELYRFEFDGQGRGPDPDALAAGSYGFAAEAYDALCRPIAAGCINRTLPAQVVTPIELVLEPVSKPARCAPESCRAGRCVQPFLDAALDSQVQRGLDGSLASDAGASDEPAWGDLDFDASSGDAGLADAALGSTDCPSGVRRPAGHCYRASFAPETFLEARKSCAAWNPAAKVLVVDDRNEERWVVEYVSEAHAFWVGVTDDDLEGIWFTERGALMIYNNFDQYSPSGGRSYNCARYSPSSGAWRDRSCFEANPVICEAP